MTDQTREEKASLRGRFLMALRAGSYATKRGLSQLGMATILAFKFFVPRWITADNAGLAAGVWLLTKGASHWGDYVGHLTCGGLILALTVLHLIAGRR